MHLAGVVGAVGIEAVGTHNLGIVGATLAVVALLVAELAATRSSATFRARRSTSWTQVTSSSTNRRTKRRA